MYLWESWACLGDVVAMFAIVQTCNGDVATMFGGIIKCWGHVVGVVGMIWMSQT